ncbi:MAG TPA: neutral zinc metallopeptidase [Usitatibacter sp.]|nr:neutral zinc metallopeptidase [Usitatibacter sp.]
MKIGGYRGSGNYSERTGGIGVGGGLGIGGVVLALVAMFFGVDPSVVLNTAGQMGTSSQPQQETSTPRDETGKFMSQVLASTEDVWTQIFRASGSEYPAPKMVRFEGGTRTACGMGQAAMGPFYCPGDQTVYIDSSFLRELSTRFRAPGDFAAAYVIAHEVGHHVQRVTGVMRQLEAARGRSSQREYNQMSVRIELQADCLAGVWGAHAARAGLLEPGDVEEGIAAAAAVGDDRLQKQSQGRVVPEAFTHGSSAQRVAAFRRGMETGNPSACETR